ncbi:hypothetical protein CLV80_107169 [Yoonia maritima]|uniref:Outer membrane protein with beta-barrel domain n=1 Tax=Yoonia maritima TaxID=1435347 RepID=A0A2T0VY11_9RHOB|nr:hypothetical protein [Yoonia maritima]PRY76992.1 hypothetical protein CLV80_107169 [Yoonia maritima]
MILNIKYLAVATAAIAPQLASADELVLRGGIASGFANEYTYALEDDDGETPINTDYGLGMMGSATYSMDNVYKNIGLDLNLQFGVLLGKDDSGDPLDNSCYITTYLGLIPDCQDRADTENQTAYADLSALGRFEVGSGLTELLAGVSYLGIKNQLETDYLYPNGFENFVSRDTEFSGLGLKIGARHQVPLQNGMTIQIEGFVAQYRGDRTTDIVDFETSNGSPNDEQTASATDTIDVTTFELTPSVLMDAAWAGDGATMEFGISYKLLSGAIDTRNFVDHGSIDPFEEGDEFDDVSSTSIFAGVTIPLQ